MVNRNSTVATGADKVSGQGETQHLPFIALEGFVEHQPAGKQGIRVDGQSGRKSQASAGNFESLQKNLDSSLNNSAMVEETKSFLSAARIGRDGNVLGTVFVDYPLASLRDHFSSLFQASIVYSLVLLLVLLVIGWLLGKQLVRPITQLRECMARVGEGDLDIHCDTVKSRDEIGELAMGFEEMLNGLREKQMLEQKILQSERLAAVGQVAAGVAHEINNPLGGMLNAVNTFKRHGQDEKIYSIVSMSCI